MANKNDDFADFLNQAIRDMLCNDFPDYCNNERKDYAIPYEIVEARNVNCPISITMKTIVILAM